MGSLIIAVLCLFSGVAYAANLSDSLTITITPDGDRGIMIDSATLSGNLTYNTTYYLSPTGGFSTTALGYQRVIATGTIGGIEGDLSGSVTGWTLGTMAAAETIAVNVVFAGIGTSVTDSDFASGVGKNYVTTASKAIGVSGGSGDGNFEITGAANDMDNLALDTVRAMYIKIMMPTSSSLTASQTLTLTITGRAAP